MFDVKFYQNSDWCSTGNFVDFSSVESCDKKSVDMGVCMYVCVFDRAWQVALDQARTVRMASSAGMPGAPPPYNAATYAQAYPGQNASYYGPHPPPYGRVTLSSCSSSLALFEADKTQTV